MVSEKYKKKLALNLVSEDDGGSVSPGRYESSGLKEKHEAEKQKAVENRVARMEEQARVNNNASNISHIPVVGAPAAAIYKAAASPAPADVYPKVNVPVQGGVIAGYTPPSTPTPTTQSTSKPTTSASVPPTGKAGPQESGTTQAPSSGGSGPGTSINKFGQIAAAAATNALKTDAQDNYTNALIALTRGQALNWQDANTARKMLDAAGTTIQGPNQAALNEAAKLNYTPWQQATPTAEEQWKAALGQSFSTSKYNINQTNLNQASQAYKPTVQGVNAVAPTIQANIPSVQAGFDVTKQQYQAGQNEYSNQTSGVAYNDLTGNEAIPTGPQTQAQINMRQALDAYRRTVAGQESSVAQIQQQRGMEQAQAQQQAILAGKDFNAASLRTAQQNIAGIQQEATRSAAELRAKEMEEARAGYAGLSTQARQLEMQNAKNKADIELARDDLNMNTILQKYQIDVDEKTKYDLAKLDGDLKARTTDAANLLQKYGYDLDTATRIAINNSQVQSQAKFKEAELIAQKYQVDTNRMLEVEKANQIAQVNMEKTRIDTVLAAQSQENQMRIAREADKLKAAGMSAEMALKAAVDGAGLKIDADYKQGSLELQKRAEIYRAELERAGMQQDQIMEAVKLRFGGDIEKLRIAAQMDIEKIRAQLQKEVEAGRISQQEADRTLQWISTGVSSAATAYSVYKS
jgi:hypothetical protein